MIIAFIPVRCGSETIPFKNIKAFCGKPLVFWSLEALQKSKKIDRIFVATDCQEIKVIVQNFNFNKVEVYDRDKVNAQGSSSTESVMLEFIEKKNFNDNDLFLLVQATSPLTRTIDFDEAIKKYKNEKADSLISCVRTKRFFWNKDGTPLNYDYRNRPRRQDFEGLFMENGAFYLNTISNIKKDKNRLSGKISIFLMEDFTNIELDEEDDWLLAEKLMQKYILK
jgi:N-acylneuraminate cytidylyltransferase